MTQCCAQVTTREEQILVRVIVEDPWCASITENGMLKARQAGVTDARQKVTLAFMLTYDICWSGFAKIWKHTKVVFGLL